LDDNGQQLDRKYNRTLIEGADTKIIRIGKNSITGVNPTEEIPSGYIYSWEGLEFDPNSYYKFDIEYKTNYDDLLSTKTIIVSEWNVETWSFEELKSHTVKVTEPLNWLVRGELIK
jgi:hypothetical protein